MLWRPAFFGVKPDLVLKGGTIAAALMGDPNASIPTPQPVHYRPMFGAFGRACAESASTFVFRRPLRHGLSARLGLQPRLVAVGNTRGGIGKASMIHNAALPQIEVDPETYEVRADGELLTCEPADGAADGAALFPVLTMRARWSQFDARRRLAEPERAGQRHARLRPTGTGAACASTTDAGQPAAARPAAGGGARDGDGLADRGRRAGSRVPRGRAS